MTTYPRIVVFATGGEAPDEGGSGFANLVNASRVGQTQTLHARITHVVSNHERGGVFSKAKALGVDFIHFPGPWTTERYLEIAALTRADFFACSGWLKFVRGLDPARTINIHPGPLPAFGGKGMHGMAVHRAVMDAYHRGLLTETEVTMHFVTAEGYDEGPVFFRLKVPIPADHTPESLQKRVLVAEHMWQPRITNLIVHNRIRWNGQDRGTLEVPPGYHITREL